MRRNFPLLLLWFVMLAVPVQGLAAASMAICGARMQQPDAAVPAVLPCHQAAHQADGPAPPQGGPATAAFPGDCDGCAGCAVVSGMALVPSLPQVGLALNGTTPIAFAGAPRAPHLASRLERPPRTNLA